MKYRFTRKQKKAAYRIVAAAATFTAAMILRLFGAIPALVPIALFLISYVTVGYDVLFKAVLGIFRGQVFDENFLMAAASVGAAALGDFAESAAVMLFYQTGELFQSVAVGKSRRSIAALTAIRPDTANLITDEGAVKVDPEDVPVGSVIAVNPGERVPLDGVIVEGATTLDCSALTGESMPKAASAGDAIVSGCVNLTGAVKVRTEKEFGQSAVSRILELVEESGMRKSRHEAFITRFAKWYTPVVCGAAAALAVLPPLITIMAGGGNTFPEWIRRALTFLVISCPCALVISVPMTFFGGVGCSSKNGILVKGSNYLEALADVTRAAFDKTGTLTEGRFRVTDVEVADGFDKDEVLRLAAFAESVSTHPVAAAIRAACDKTPGPGDVRDITEIAGVGVEATVGGKRVSVGRPKDENVLKKHVGATVSVVIDGVYAGTVTASDTVKTDAKEALSELKTLGVERTYILTGDRAETAGAVAESVGADEVAAGLMPDEKLGKLEEILKERKGALCYVGDGINDAPVLARADVGVAMGALGSDAAIEAADVVIMDDDIKKLPLAIRIAKKTVGIAKENIVFALAVKAICLILGAIGLAGMWVAVFADVGVMIAAVLNAARALRIK